MGRPLLYTSLSNLIWIVSIILKYLILKIARAIFLNWCLIFIYIICLLKFLVSYKLLFINEFLIRLRLYLLINFENC